MKLRSYQNDILSKIDKSLSNDLVQLDTGAGKTPIIAALAKKYKHVIAIAHRNILIAQISEKFTAFDIEHDVIATTHTKRRCIIAGRMAHRKELITEGTTKHVASIDSLMARHKRGLLTLNYSLPYIILIDEAHHVVKENKWGKVRELFPNARFIGFTATPCRLDGRSLHIDKEGIFDNLIQAEELKNDSVKTLISKNYMSDFEAYSIPSDFDTLHEAGNNKRGDYQPVLLSEIFDHDTDILGEVVSNYNTYAKGKQAVAICISIRNAEEIAKKFCESGISSACINSKMSTVEISRIIDAFINQDIKVLCNVDMIGEGFDVPGIEAIIMLRKTRSFAYYRQWIGRALRPMQDKKNAIIIDHVGNVLTHGLPDTHMDWDLKNPSIPNRASLIDCQQCKFIFAAWKKSCPNCGAENDLNKRIEIGGYYVNHNFIDFHLCKVIRQKIEEQVKLDNYNKMMDSEIMSTTDLFSQGAIGELCKRIKALLVEMLKNAITIREINDFLQSHQASSEGFWIDNFSIMDLKKPKQDKFIRVYRKWLKSR